LGKPEGKRPLGIPKRILEDSIQGVGWGNLREVDHWGDPSVDGRIVYRVLVGET